MTLLELLTWVVIGTLVTCWIGMLIVYGCDGPHSKPRRLKHLRWWLEGHSRVWSFVVCFAFGLPMLAGIAILVYLCYLAGQVQL